MFNNVETVKLFSTAIEFSSEVLEHIALFPDSEQVMMVPMIRDDVLTTIELLAYGLAGYHPSDQQKLLQSSETFLEMCHSKISMCRNLKLIDEAEFLALDFKYRILQGRLNKRIRMLSDQNRKSVRSAE